MTDERKRKELYSNLLKDNYDLPAYDKFTSDMTDENLRRELYDNLIADNYDLPAFEQFTSDIIGDKLNTPAPTPQPTAQQTTATAQPKAPVKTVEQQSKERLLDLAEKKFGTRDENKLRQMAQEQFGTTDPKEIQQIAKDYVQGGGMKPVQKKTTPTTPTDPVQAAIQEAYNTAKATTSDPIKQGEELANQLKQKAVEMYGEENLPELTKNFQQAVKEETENRNVREQITNLSQDIDRLREEEVEKATDKVIDEVAKQKQKLNDKNSSIGDKARAAFRLNTMTGSNTQGLYGPNTGTIGQELRNANVRQLDAAKLILRDAKRMIAEADHNAQEGTFGKWWESSFAGGAARGFAQRITDLSTWDFGLSDVEKGALLYDALNKADKGEQLTPSEQALLDAVTINALTEQYFANQVGRGYKAGQVSAEAIPFMLEMIINPASGIGTALSSKLTRYAIKRFGKAAAKKGVKGFLAKAGTKAVKYGTQAGGSILAGGAMATTTGAGRTTAGAFERANEALMRGEKVDWGEAWWDALKSSTISYSTEMLGELFRPIKSFIGKGAGKLASSNFGKAIRLDKVQRFIDDVSSTQLSQIVNDFEKNAKWTGTFEEYLEEVLDNTGQAAFVGDQRFRGADGRILFSNDPEAVFNLENNIDTFISVALLGGVFSGIRTVGYRTPKYKAKKEMINADEAGLSAFNGNSDLWNGFRNSLSFGNVEEVKTVLRDVMTNPDYTEQQKRAVWEYAGKATAYKGILSSEQKRRASGEETQQQIDAEMSFERGYNSDEQAAHDIALEMNDEALGNRSAEERKAAWDGVQQQIEDNADRVAETMRRDFANKQHKTDGMVKEVKVLDDEGNEKVVYLVDGNVTMLQGGEQVDTEQSDQQVYIYDPQTDETKPIAATDIKGFVMAISHDDLEEQIQQARDLYVQQAIDKAQGKITVNIGDDIPLSSGIMGKVLAISEDGEEITVGGIDENGNPQQEVMQRSDLQAVADATAIESYYQRHPDIARAEESETAEEQQPVAEEQQTETTEEQTPVAETETPQEGEQPTQEDVIDDGFVGGIPAEYEKGMTLEWDDADGGRQTLIVTGNRFTRKPKAGGGMEDVPDPEGRFYEVYDTAEGDLLHIHDSELERGMVGYYPATEEQPAEPTAETPAETPETPVEAETESEAPITPTEPQTSLTMPMREVRGKQIPAYEQATPEQAHNYIYNTTGLDEATADQFVQNQIDAADKHIADLQKREPQIGTDIDAYQQAHDKWQDDMLRAQITKEQWEQVRELQHPTEDNAGPQAPEAPQQPQTLEQGPQQPAGVAQTNTEQEAEPTTEATPTAQQIYNDITANSANPTGKIAATVQDRAKTLATAKTKLDKAQADYDNAPYGKEENAMAKLDKAKANYDAALADKQLWDEIKAQHDRVRNAALKEQQEKEKAAIEASEERERQRQAEELAKRQEQEERGANAAHPAIREKWESAEKVDGYENEIALANGETIKGHYVLVESGAATPSHNPNNEFARYEEFPVDENGQTVNDRDYERDKQAQRITRQMADNYDSRALKDVPVVSNEGVVLSGNGRTMAGELAAQQNTDGAYIEHLKKYPQQFGFTAEQVSAMQHPRVVFVADENLPYTTETFAKFNAEEKKSQSRTEQAVKFGKTVDDATFGRIINTINRFDTIGDFYNDPKAAPQALAELHGAGVINDMQLAEMMDGDKISARGREILENMLIGKAFESNPDAIRQLAAFPSMRERVITALTEISNNIHLGEDYSLENELAEAISLAYQARKSGIKAGEKVNGFARQQNLFPFDTGDTVADYTNIIILSLGDCINDAKVSQLKKALSLYNQRAENSAAGQYDMFSGVIKTKEEIYKEVEEILNYGTKQEQQTALDAADEQRKRDALQEREGETGVQEDGVADGSDAGSGERLANNGGIIEQEEGLSEDEADDLILASASRAKPIPQLPLPLTSAGWQSEFGNGLLQTPMGEVKLGENQFAKMIEKGRENEAGMIKPTLTDPDFVIEEASQANDGNTERPSSYLFVKAFIGNDGKKHYFFKSVTVKKDGLEINISNHIDSAKRLRKSLKKGKLLYRFDGGAQTEQTPASASVTTSPNDLQGVSDGKDTKKNATDKKNVANSTESEQKNHTVTPAQYTTKRGKVLDMHLVTFGRELTKVEFAAGKEIAKQNRGWWDRDRGGFMMRDEESAKQLAEALNNKEKVADEQPLTLQDIKENNSETKDQSTEQEQPKQEQTEEQPKAKSKWVNDEDADRFEELRQRMRKKLGGQMNMDIDPEIFSIGVEMSYLMLKKGARKFADFAKKMIEALGDAVRPYLKSFYNGARDLPEMESYAKELTPYDEVRTFDVENFDKEGAKDLVKTAATIVREQEVEKEAEQATEKIKKKRNKNRKENEKNPVSLQNENQLDLFGGSQIKTENNENTNVQTGTSETGRGGHQPQQNEPMGGSTGNETERPDGRGVGGRDKYDSGNDGVGGVGVSKLPAGEQRIESEQSKRNLNNNHAERGTDYAPKGVDARIEANIKAIELMQQLVESGQKATPEQMSVLRKYSGWGGLGKAFGNLTEIDGVKTTAGRLRDLLGDEGYEQANMSRNSAYFTPAHVIDTLWDIARALGFKGGNVLEGSAGIGNIIGLMPQDMSERSDIHAVEIDQTTGNILSLLYPDAKVDVQGFEATQVKNGSVDLCITNVPFVTGLRVNDTTGDKDLSKKFHDIHDFCIAKNVRKLRDGGIGIFITSSGTLDNSQKLRDWLVSEGNADVVGAFRLNNETFGGTAATSDIIVIRKRVNGKKSAHAIDVLPITGERVAEYDTGETKKVKGQEIRVVKNLSMDYNKYFVQHPEMMGGEMAFGFERGDNYRPTSKGLYPKRGVNQNERLQSFVQSLQGFDDEAAAPVSIEANNNKVYESLGDDVKEGSMVVSNGQLCVARYGQAVPLNLNKNKVKGHTKEECFNSYKKIKDALSAVLEYQTTHEENDGLKPLLDELNNAYDNFVNVYGRLHKNMAIPFLKNDVDFANILALEKYNERIDVKTGERIAEYGKTDIFSKRVVEKEKTPSPTNVKDGITASIYMHGRIDLPWIAEKITQSTGKPISEKEVREEIINSGLGFENPATTQMEVSYEYLSGNVREKLQQANEANGVEGQEGKYSANIKALENVIPMNIPAHLIDFSIGSSWITPELYEEYIKERTDIDVKCVNVDGTWFMRKPHWRNEEKNRAMGVVSEKLNKTILGTELIEAAMTNRAITVSETRKTWDGKRETITDSDATSACANKVDEIRQDFKDWAKAKMLSEPAFSEQIEQIYNEKFNNFVPKSIPEEYVPKHFGGAATIVDNKPFSLRPHQGKAAVRATTQPLLLAHEVGTGKTYTLITAAMEMRRLGTARKPMIVVQNSTVGQFVESAKKLYPNAKVLTIDDKEHDEEGRKNFYAKIKYNDWDMIVVPQSVFERIPDSEERQMAFVADKIEEKEKALELLQDEDIDGSSWIVKQAEREINDLQAELTELTAATSKKKKERDEKKDAIIRQNAEVKAFEMLDRMTDNVENFDDMGIDALLVDEAHEYKHLGFATAMQRGVKGIDPSYSKKAQGVYLKTQAVLEKNNGRNVVFATGTPISNTAAEIWTFMRYLMPADTMKDYGIYYFDDFVRNFGNLTQMLEFTTSGKFKENNRFAGYVNLPELVRIWSGVADTVLTKEAGGVNDKIPEMEGGKAKDIYLPQTKSLRAVMKYVKAELDRFDNMTSKEKKKNRHIPLKMYGIAKAAAVDARLVVSDAIDEPQSKTNEAVRQTLKSLEQTKSYNGTVAIFADNYQNKRSGFNLYEDIRQKLIEAGIPAEQIVVMKSGMSVNKKLDIFDRVNRGEVRVIMGSTFTLGTGVNIQERLHTLIHLDAPNRPMDYTQRNGRILRQGNLHKEMGIPVRVLRFGVEDSLDVTAYQRLKTKGAIADSIMNGKQMLENSMENRAIEEEEDVFGDTVAQLSGSEYAMLKNQAEKDVRKYENKKKQWEADQTYCHNEIPRLESTLRNYDRRLKQAEEASQKVEQSKEQHKGQSPAIVIDGKTYPNIEALADFIKEFNKKVKEAENSIRENPYGTSEKKLTIKINVGGFNFTFNTKLSYETASEQGNLFNAIRRKMTYDCEELSMEDTPVKQSLLRVGLEDILENVVSGKEFAERVEKLKQSIAKTQESLKQVKAREGKPFEFTKELETAHRRFDEYSELMKKEMAEKEQKYAEVDAEVDAATEVTEAEEVSEEETDSPVYRDEDTTPPDPWLSTYEESLASARRFGYTKKQHDAFIERSRRYTRKFIADAVAKLNLTDDVQVVETIDEVQGLTEQEREKRRKKRGWYDPKTNRIVIILENHHSRDDVLKTILHEGAGHYGLRKMFGKHFDDFLDNVYEHSETEIRRAITKLARDKYNYDFRRATEEYLATMAEGMESDLRYDTLGGNSDELPEQFWSWQKIKDLFWEMMSKIGLKIKSWFYGSIGENELRYVLWSSYQRLKYPGRYRDFVRTAEDVVMQEELKVGDFEQPAEERRGWWEKSEAEEKEEVIEDMGLNDEDAERLRKEMEKEETRKRTPENQTWRKLKERHPNDLVMLSDGKGFYSMYGEDAERVAKLLGIVLRKTKEKGGVYVISFPERDLDGYLHKLINAGHRVAVGETLDADKVSEDVAEYERRAPIKPYPVQKNTEQGDDVYFRDEDDDGDNFTDRDRAIARDEYERIVATGGYQFQEAMQDSMLGLRKAMQAILGAGKDFRIEEVPGNENAYLAENRMSSTNKAEQHYYYVLYMKPLLKAIHLIAGNSEAKRQELADYMMAKHGLERNLKFAERDFAEYQKEYPATNKTIDDYRDRDYAGLTALTGETNVAAAEAKAQMMVDEYEANHDVTLLWEATKRATGVTLAKIYRSGLLSKESYEQIRDQFDYYIPLQGFDETTSDEVYGYLTSRKGPFGSPIKHAEGRTSKADDPIATIALMADKAIQQANRNEMKKLFLNFVENHPSDLVSVSKLWLHKDAATGDWVPVFPDIEADDTPAEVERKVEEFETKMQQLAEQHPKEYKSGMDAKNFPYRVLPENRNEHQVLVKRNGETFVLTINGNPRAAQALNGLTNPDVKTGGFIGGIKKAAQFVNHQLSAFYTTRNPDFVVSNFFRDMLYSNCMTWVKEGGNYALNFHKNFGKFNPVTMRWLFGKWNKGTLDDSKPIEYMFKQFMLNGGETGYTNVRDIEAHKREIARELKRQSSTTRQVWSALGKQLDLLNESVENCARFAAFITSIEMGRSLERSIYDAKEVSVNFNKKGSGDKMIGSKGQDRNYLGLLFNPKTYFNKKDRIELLAQSGSYLSGAGRLLYVFWNAGLQGMTNFGRAAKRHPAKFTAGAAAIFTLGAVIPLIAKALWGGDDDDENAYYNLPEYVRRSNICIGAGDLWITIPLPPEFRAIYGMGELATGVITGEEHYSKGETARQIISQGSQILPLDFMEGGGGWHAFIPTAVKPIVEASSNKSWVGLPIYKDTPYNQNDPEFTKAYKSADKNIVGASRWLNDLTGGDDFKKGAIDINPSKVEYVLNGYLGGYFKVPNQLVKMAETAFGDREFEWKNMIMANRLVKSGDERTANRKLQNEFFNLKAEYEETKRLLKKYENAANEGVLKYAEKLDYLENSKEYGRYLIFDEYKKDIDGAYKAMNEAEDEEIYKASENEYYEYLRELVDAIHRYEKGEDVNSILNYQSN